MTAPTQSPSLCVGAMYMCPRQAVTLQPNLRRDILVLLQWHVHLDRGTRNLVAPSRHPCSSTSVLERILSNHCYCAIVQDVGEHPQLPFFSTAALAVPRRDALVVRTAAKTLHSPSGIQPGGKARSRTTAEASRRKDERRQKARVTHCFEARHACHRMDIHGLKRAICSCNPSDYF